MSQHISFHDDYPIERPFDRRYWPNGVNGCDGTGRRGITFRLIEKAEQRSPSGSILLVRPDGYLALYVPDLQQEVFLSVLQRWVMPLEQAQQSAGIRGVSSLVSRISQIVSFDRLLVGADTHLRHQGWGHVKRGFTVLCRRQSRQGVLLLHHGTR